MNGAAPTAVELQVFQLVALWRLGEAALHDPVLANMSARLMAALDRSSPGVVARVQDALAAGERG